MNKRKNFYLIFKEAINNAIKYSNCKTIDVALHVHGHKIELRINDDGQGFDVSKMQLNASKSLAGNGLRNMQMRAQEINANFSIESEKGKGTSIYLAFSIP